MRVRLIIIARITIELYGTSARNTAYYFDVSIRDLLTVFKLERRTGEAVRECSSNRFLDVIGIISQEAPS